MSFHTTDIPLAVLVKASVHVETPENLVSCQMSVQLIAGGMVSHS